MKIKATLLIILCAPLSSGGEAEQKRSIEDQIGSLNICSYMAVAH